MAGIAEVLWQLALFLVLIFGGGAAWGPVQIASPLARLLAGIAIVTAGWFAGAFAGFALGLSNRTTAMALGVALLGSLGIRLRRIVTLWREAEVRRALAGWLVFACGSLGLLSLVATYSGGAWVADWFEQWQRTEFFRQRGPLNTQFLGIYGLGARPPLANVTIATWLEVTSKTFAAFQVFMTLLGTLSLLPLWVLAQRWCRQSRTGWWVVLVLMLNPCVAQNVTFAWTKLPTAAFVLIAIVLLTEDLSAPAHRFVRAAGALALSVAMLAHYSAGPWVIALALGLVCARRAEWRQARFRRELALLAIVFALPVGLWLGWAATQLGPSGAFAANSTVDNWHSQTAAERATVPLRNIADTLVPYPLREEPTDGRLHQRSKLGYLRDIAFSWYQTNLPLAFGFAGLWILAAGTQSRRTAGRAPFHGPPAAERLFFAVTVPIAIVLGIAAHTARDEWGLAHICLQPLVTLGLGVVAARLSAGGLGQIVVWACFATVDLGLGIGLHFGIQSGALARFVDPGSSPEQLTNSLTHAAMVNAAEKTQYHLSFLADRIHAPVSAVVLWLALCGTAVIVRLRGIDRTAARL